MQQKGYVGLLSTLHQWDEGGGFPPKNKINSTTVFGNKLQSKKMMAVAKMIQIQICMQNFLCTLNMNKNI